MVKFINIGFGNMIATDKIIAIVSPDSAPVRRTIQDAKERTIDATCGRRTRAVIFMESGQIILSAVLPETISGRLKEQGDVETDE
ncbi:MAG: DUF370 domain-containing protein [Clostridiales bacterium]|nr:DUF370 domain-containing protein [Clostridiales bacterium]